MKYMVIGFYTPNYADVASRFSENLHRYDIPHTLYPISQVDWEDAILWKPSIVWTAMAQFPNTTLVLMDVDCLVRGPIDGALDFTGDVALHFRAKIAKGRRSMWPSARMIAFRPTDAARSLVQAWTNCCSDHGGTRNDEQQLMRAISHTPNVSISILPPAYAAHEFDEIGPDAVIVHVSEHDKIRKSYGAQSWLKRKRRAAISWLIGKPYGSWKYGLPTWQK